MDTSEDFPTDDRDDLLVFVAINSGIHDIDVIELAGAFDAALQDNDLDAIASAAFGINALIKEFGLEALAGPVQEFVSNALRTSLPPGDFHLQIKPEEVTHWKDFIGSMKFVPAENNDPL